MKTDLSDFLASIPERGLDPLRAEYVLPTAMDEMIRGRKAIVHVLETPDVWYGMTYREDLPTVRAAFQKMHEEGLYSENLYD